ncbi:amino acid adenylation domain-containing protein [Streptomyces sp. BI20]|uniref:non-ribosomal peptide synthetase family protein n=1 Tax=Streptomyces sp. BI20 TaxID=3403460 RepID=UPI003C752EB7
MATVQFAVPTRNVRHESGACLPGLLDQQVTARPEAAAVVTADRRLTFRELAAEAARLADHLHATGVAVDTPVGLYTEPSAELVTGAWGILAAGAAYLPLSPEYPEDRIRYMIESSGAGIVVTQDHLRAALHRLVPRGTRIVTFSDLDRGPDHAPAGSAAPCRLGGNEAAGTAPAPDRVEHPARGPRPDSLAYVIYTSGSTGKPKGVMIEHRSIVSQLRWMQAFGHLGEHVRILQKTPMSFDAAQWEILAPAAGATVVVGAPGIHRDPEALLDTVERLGVTALQAVPTLLQALVDTERLGTARTLTRVFSGGEPLSRRLARTLLAELPGTDLVNLYGPTETTINATACLVDPDELRGDDGPEGNGTVPIGVPVDNTTCFILDEEHRPVDIGTTGELYIGGVQLARGYLGRPDLTEERFLPSPFVPTERLYRTGDLAHWNPDGTITCVGRADNQIKLRGYRVELDEISVAVEEHTWVRRAAAVVVDDPRTGFRSLVAAVELNPREAALMDQGNHGGHHQSKSSKVQVKAQLAEAGARDPEELAGRTALPLPGREADPALRREIFARKTYRFYDGGPVTRADLHALLAPRELTPAAPLDPADLDLDRLGTILRRFGPVRSEERLLPKYSYASPGALYATQLYLEVDGIPGVPAGLHYHHPSDHSLVRVADPAPRPAGAPPLLRVHFLGKRRAIESVYANNVLEVLEFEAGHMLGVFEETLPAHGLDIRAHSFDPAVKDRLDVAAEDHYLGTFEIHAHDGTPRPTHTELYLQSHPDRIADLPAGHYRWTEGRLEHLSDALIARKHVIAINQLVYDRASFGITAISRAPEPWLDHIAMGTTLHHLQRNGLGLGFMSSGYSSKSGNPLPAARRIDEILADRGVAPGPSYFFLGGKVTPGQIADEGMNEDAVHTRGPAEIIKDELASFLPDYMIPNRVVILDELPLTANGKVDAKNLAASDRIRAAGSGRPWVAPAGPYQTRLAEVWGKALKYEDVSADDDFFEAGGNSLTAVALVNRVNRDHGIRLPLQVIFEAPRLAALAARIADAVGGAETGGSRLLLLHPGAPAEDPTADPARPVFAWPGLGGYPMNLRLLGRESALGGAFYGIQAHGINPGETPHPTVQEMAAADVAEIRRIQPAGPYRLWGYSFGARVAFETAWQLEQLGESVEHLLLICPGNPKVRAADAERHGRAAEWTNPAYVTILHSVFAGTVTGPQVADCLAATRDEDSFVAFVVARIPGLDEALVRRITRVVAETYAFDYDFREWRERRVTAPVTVFKATGDEYSFIESGEGRDAATVDIRELTGDHYSVLREHGVGELAAALRAAVGAAPATRD